MKRLDNKKEKVLAMRLKGMSYSQIKSEIKVSKSTLSLWLQKYPLSEKRIRELRDWNPQRIEKCRITKENKRNLFANKHEVVYSFFVAVITFRFKHYNNISKNA